jgi:hypothetical protein
MLSLPADPDAVAAFTAMYGPRRVMQPRSSAAVAMSIGIQDRKKLREGVGPDDGVPQRYLDGINYSACALMQ